MACGGCVKDLRKRAGTLEMLKCKNGELVWIPVGEEGGEDLPPLDDDDPLNEKDPNLLNVCPKITAVLEMAFQLGDSIIDYWDVPQIGPAPTAWLAWGAEYGSQFTVNDRRFMALFYDSDWSTVNPRWTDERARIINEAGYALAQLVDRNIILTDRDITLISNFAFNSGSATVDSLIKTAILALDTRWLKGVAEKYARTDVCGSQLITSPGGNEDNYEDEAPAGKVKFRLVGLAKTLAGTGGTTFTDSMIDPQGTFAEGIFNAAVYDTVSNNRNNAGVGAVLELPYTADWRLLFHVKVQAPADAWIQASGGATLDSAISGGVTRPGVAGWPNNAVTQHIVTFTGRYAYAAVFAAAVDATPIGQMYNVYAIDSNENLWQLGRVGDAP